MYDLSIVVPAYNEVNSLPLLINKYKEAKGDIKFQLVIVNNGSTDHTKHYLQQIKEEFIKVIHLKKNNGYGNGIHEGLKQCDAEYIGWSHADMQCNPEDVFKGYRLLSKRKQFLVKGHRRTREWQASMLTYCFTMLAKIILFKSFDDINGQPKIFHKDLFKTFKNPPKEFSYDLYAQYKALLNNYTILPFKVNYDKRIYGESKWSTTLLSKSQTIKGFIRDIFLMRLKIIK